MLTPGTTLGGRYRLDERIAGGGMGDVWRGTDEVLGRTVAVKVLLPALLEEPGFAERFHGEARTMATINHPGVVDVYDYGSQDGTAFLVMEYVEGDALARTLHRVGRLTPGRTMALLAQAADALHAAHVKGIVHRDVKPGNLLVRPNGTLVLTDFGIARAAGSAQLTAAGSVLGTASYISPEQAAGQPASPLSDVYALGVVGYQCLSGRRPFEGDNPLEIALRHVRDPAPPLPGDVPPAARQIVERAMAKDPAARWPCGAALAQAAREAAALLSAGGPTATMPPTGPGARPVSPYPGPFPQTSPVSGKPPQTSPISGSPVQTSPISGSPVQTSPISGSPAQTWQLPAAQPAGPPPAGSVSQPFPGPFGGLPPDGRAPVGHPGRPPGYAGVPLGQPPGRVRSGGALGSRRRLAGTAAALVTLVVLALGGTAGYLIAVADDDPGGTQPTSSAGTSTGRASSPAPGSIPVGCPELAGKPLSDVRSSLERQGFKVRPEKVDSSRPANEVIEVTPCNARPGETVTVKVSTGKGGPSGSPKAKPSCLLQEIDPGYTCPPGAP